jgi:phospholipase C
MHASRLTAVAAVPLFVLFGFAAPAGATPPPKGPSIDHIVVIYEENHSFDNLFGGWEGVNGLAEAAPQAQVAADGSVLPCLPQNDVNLTSPPLPVTCTSSSITQHLRTRRS